MKQLSMGERFTALAMAAGLLAGAPAAAVAHGRDPAKHAYAAVLRDLLRANDKSKHYEGARRVPFAWNPGEAHVYCPQQGDAESADAVKDLATRGRKRGFCAVLATQRLRIEVGPVSTTHPKAGSRASFTPPPPTAKVRAMLPSLGDLPAQAEERARSIEEARKEIAELKRKLTIAERAQPPAPPSAPPIEIPVLRQDQLVVLERSLDRAQALMNDLGVNRRDLESVATNLRESVEAGRILASRAMRATAPVLGAALPARTQAVLPRPAAPVQGGVPSRSGVEAKILSALAELELLGASAPARELVAFLAGYTHLNSKGFTNGLGALRSAGLIDYPQQGQVVLTAAGQAEATYPAAPRSSAEIQQRVIALLGGASARILEPLIAAYPGALPRTALAQAAGYDHLNSKGFTNAVGRLRTLGFIDYPTKGMVQAQPVLFLEGA